MAAVSVPCPNLLSEGYCKKWKVLMDLGESKATVQSFDDHVIRSDQGVYLLDILDFGAEPEDFIIPDNLPAGFRLGYDQDQAQEDWNSYDERSVHMVGSLTKRNDPQGWGPVFAAGLRYEDFAQEPTVDTQPDLEPQV
jgi:hypothetical protein